MACAEMKLSAEPGLEPKGDPEPNEPFVKVPFDEEYVPLAAVATTGALPNQPSPAEDLARFGCMPPLPMASGSNLEFMWLMIMCSWEERSLSEGTFMPFPFMMPLIGLSPLPTVTGMPVAVATDGRGFIED